MSEFTRPCVCGDDYCIKGALPSGMRCKHDATDSVESLKAHLTAVTRERDEVRVELEKFRDLARCRSRSGIQAVVEQREWRKKAEALQAELATLRDGWISVKERLPEFNKPVWLYEPGRGIWIGDRYDEAEGWLWTNSHGAVWHNGTKWDCDDQLDDDYKPTHWRDLPAPPTDGRAE